MRVVGRDHALEDRAADEVARRELLHRVRGFEEALAVAVAQHGAGAAQRLADQEARRAGDVERGRVELHELAVDQPRAGAEAQRVAVAAGAGRVGRLAVDLAGAAGGDDDRARLDRRSPSCPTGGSPGCRSAGRRRRRSGPSRSTRSRTNTCGRTVTRGCSCSARTSARCTSRPVAAPLLCTTRGWVWPPSRDRSSVPSGSSPSAVEARAEVLQPGERVGAAVDDRAHDVLVGDAGTDPQRIGHVRLDAVVGQLHDGDAALRPRGVGLVEVALGDEQDLGAFVGGAQRRGGPGDAGADHQHVGAQQRGRAQVERGQQALEARRGVRCVHTSAARADQSSFSAASSASISDESPSRAGPRRLLGHDHRLALVHPDQDRRGDVHRRVDAGDHADGHREGERLEVGAAVVVDDRAGRRRRTASAPWSAPCATASG